MPRGALRVGAPRGFRLSRRCGDRRGAGAGLGVPRHRRVPNAGAPDRGVAAGRQRFRRERRAPQPSVPAGGGRPTAPGGAARDPLPAGAGELARRSATVAARNRIAPARGPRRRGAADARLGRPHRPLPHSGRRGERNPALSGPLIGPPRPERPRRCGLDRDRTRQRGTGPAPQRDAGRHGRDGCGLRRRAPRTNLEFGGGRRVRAGGRGLSDARWRTPARRRRPAGGGRSEPAPEQRPRSRERLLHGPL